MKPAPPAIAKPRDQEQDLDRSFASKNYLVNLKKLELAILNRKVERIRSLRREEQHLREKKERLLLKQEANRELRRDAERQRNLREIRGRRYTSLSEQMSHRASMAASYADADELATR